MFDIGFLEMLVVAVLALLVLGPERLPGAIRTVSLTIGRIKRGFSDVRHQVEREIGADEIRQQLNNERIMAELEKNGLHAGSPAKASPSMKPAPAPATTPPEPQTEATAVPDAPETEQQQTSRHEQP